MSASASASVSVSVSASEASEASEVSASISTAAATSVGVLRGGESLLEPVNEMENENRAETCGTRHRVVDVSEVNGDGEPTKKKKNMKNKKANKPSAEKE